jgi:pimeloyl-ACP methyl ester carboxylesterase
LQERLEECGWDLVQIFLTSSHVGFGLSSLAQDCEEIDKLVETLIEQFSSESIILIGHSTGCQDIVLYLKIGKHINHIRGAVLQAPVSDREYLSEFQEVVDNLQLAQQLIKEGKEQHLMPPMQVFPRQAITAYRFHSLVSRFGDDDMFSSDFTDEELKQRLGHIKIPTLVVQSLQGNWKV